MVNSFDDAINLLTSQGKFYINLGLERIKKILDLSGNPQDKFKCIHVAGTNGKGSVCSILSTILKESGFKTGLFTSPHLINYTERIQINGINISQETFAKKIFEIQNLAEKNQIHLTEFEILTAVMFVYFAENNVDFAVIETGLGGRYDATNVIKKPVCSIITTIDFDHTERLGNTIEKIATEKAGIIKKDCPIVISPDNLGLETVKKIATKEQLYLAKTYNLGEMSLKGLHQQENLSLALSCLCSILPDIKIATIQSAMQKIIHHGRFELFEDKNILIDGAHNPNGIKVLRKNLDTFFKDKPLRFIFGCLKNKNYEEMIELLFKEGDEIYFNHFDYPNAASYEELSSVCKFPSKKYIGETFADNKLTVICGSLYMIGDFLKTLNI